MPLTIQLAADEVARARVLHLRQFMPSGDARCMTGAVGIALNQWTSGCDYPLEPVFTTQTGEDVRLVAVTVVDRDMRWAAQLATDAKVPLEDVLSAALCTGLGLLLGDAEMRGPFALPEPADDAPTPQLYRPEIMSSPDLRDEGLCSVDPDASPEATPQPSTKPLGTRRGSDG